jgi:acyl-CoA synthetase (NDP forming)
VIKSDLSGIFDPKSVAVVGVSSKGPGPQFGGADFVDALLSCGFKGNIYPINPKGGEVLGLKVYPSLRDISGPVDYVICCIAAPQVPQLVEDCAAKSVKGIQIYTGGFSESGTEEGKRLEQEIAALVSQNGIRVIGPNCVGIYCPRTGLAFLPDFPSDTGPVAIISQSGGNSFYIVREGAKRGIRFSKVISYGNACDVNESDLLEFLADDKDTKLIGAYVEGVKDGRRFVRVLEEAAKAKPVIVLKGGIGEAGARAVASHTGALVGSDEAWDGLLRQLGAIRAYSLEELIDMAVTFYYLPSVLGRKVSVVGGGGGSSVLSTDDCTNAGLIVPRFPVAIQDKLKGYMEKGSIGVILSNPVDLSDQGWGALDDCIKTILGYEGIDLAILQFGAGSIPRSDVLKAIGASFVDTLVEISRESTKPVVIVVHSLISDDSWWVATEVERRCGEVGIPFYHSLRNAARAISRFLDYHERNSRWNL